MNNRLRFKLSILTLLCVALAIINPAYADFEYAPEDLFKSRRLAADDPGRTGHFSVAKQDYNLGDEVFQPVNFPTSIDVKGSVHYPQASYLRNRPVLIFVHGRHETCYNPDSNEARHVWPCNEEFSEEIPNYTGHAYLAEHLASWGFVVISISTNGINPFDQNFPDNGSDARSQLIKHHLDLWQDWNNNPSGPFGNEFIGKLDLHNIGALGHSRGGEGIARFHLDNLGSEQFTVRALMPVAASNITLQSLSNASLGNVISYCDGDLPRTLGVRYFDKSLYLDEDKDSNDFRHQFVFMGANHNYYSTIWTPGEFPAGTSDDWSQRDQGQLDPHCGTNNESNNRLTPSEQRAALTAYASAFFRASLLGGTHITRNHPFLIGKNSPPASSTLTDDDIRISFHAPASQRLDVNIVENEANDVNNLGFPIDKRTSFNNVCGITERRLCMGNFNFQEPHNGVYDFIGFDENEVGVTQQRLSWRNGGIYVNQLPTTDATRFNTLQVRVATDILNSAAEDLSEFRTVLVDEDGNLSDEVRFDNPEVFDLSPGSAEVTNNLIPKTLLNTAFVSLDKFSGVDLSRITGIAFTFPTNTGNGSILISDVAFSNTNKRHIPNRRRYFSQWK